MFYLRFFWKQISEKWANRKSFLVSNVSESLISLKKWAIRSGRSEEMRDCERIAHFAQKNERMSELLIFLSELLIRSFFDKKPAIRLELKWANSQPWFSTKALLLTLYKEIHSNSVYFVNKPWSRYIFLVPMGRGSL